MPSTVLAVQVAALQGFGWRCEHDDKPDATGLITNLEPLAQLFTSSEYVQTGSCSLSHLLLFLMCHLEIPTPVTWALYSWEGYLEYASLRLLQKLSPFPSIRIPEFGVFLVRQPSPNLG